MASSRSSSSSGSRGRSSHSRGCVVAVATVVGVKVVGISVGFLWLEATLMKGFTAVCGSQLQGTWTDFSSSVLLGLCPSSSASVRATNGRAMGSESHRAEGSTVVIVKLLIEIKLLRRTFT